MARTKQTARCSKGGKAPRFAGKSAIAILPKVSNKFKSSNTIEEEKEEEEIKEENEISLNNFVIKFDDQKDCENKATESNFIRCTSCQAILNSKSKLIDKKAYLESFQNVEEQPNDAQSQQLLILSEEDKVWICEFCDHHNKLPNIFEIPQDENPCFILEKAKAGEEKAQEENGGSSVIFCIDLSGSMDQTVMSVPQTQKGKQKYLSRKDCVVSALKSQLNTMKNAENPCFVGLVTFSEEVNLIGDGSNKPISYRGEVLNKYEEILETTQTKYKKIIQKNANENFLILTDILNKLETSGSTALGPGLLAAVALATKGKPGSKVIICTDGLANLGLGSLETGNNKESQKFYEKVALLAKSKGISISVITIKGDADCNIQTLSKVALETDGVISRVDPQKISSDFKFILSDEILGTNAKLSLRLNRAFKFINEDPQFLKENGCLYEKELGNFGVSTEFMLEFEVKTAEELKADHIKSINLLKNENLPMQMELTYTSTKDQTKYLQVFTDWRENREQKKDEKIDIEVLTRVGKQKLGKMVHKGKYEEAEQLNEQLENLVNNLDDKTDEKGKKVAKRFASHAQQMKTLIKKKQNQKQQKVQTGNKLSNKRRTSRSRSRDRDRSRSRSGSNFSDSDEEIIYKSLKRRKSVSRSRSRSRSASPVLNKGKKKVVKK